MTVDNRYNAGAFSIGGCLIIISFSLATAAAPSLVGGDIRYFIVFLVIAAMVGSLDSIMPIEAYRKQLGRTETS